MMKQHQTTRDVFALSLGGVNVVKGFSVMPVISYERLRTDQARNLSKTRQLNWRAWMPRRYRVA